MTIALNGRNLTDFPVETTQGPPRDHLRPRFFRGTKNDDCPRDQVPSDDSGRPFQIKLLDFKVELPTEDRLMIVFTPRRGLRF